MNSELVEIYQADQNDQPPKISWEQLKDPQVLEERGKRIRERIEKVKQILDQEEIQNALDNYQASLVCQHGSTAEDFELAHYLAKKAMELEPENMDYRWLYAATEVCKHLHNP